MLDQTALVKSDTHGLEPNTDLDGVHIRATPRCIVDEDLGAVEVFFSENHQHAGNG